MGVFFVEGVFQGLPVDGILGRRGIGGGHRPRLIAEERLEGFRELGADVAVVLDDDPGEEHLVESPSVRIGCSRVCGLRIGDEPKRRVEILLDLLVLQIGSAESLLDVRQLIAETGLLGLEQIDRDGVGVVSLQELRPLGDELRLTTFEPVAFLLRLCVKGVQLLAKQLVKPRALLLGELVVGIEVDDPLFHGLDEVKRPGSPGGLVSWSTGLRRCRERVECPF